MCVCVRVRRFAGVLGNIFVPDTHFDSIYSSAKHADVMRMITGTPWFAGIVANQLPFLRGDGTIDAAYNTEETVADTSAPSDLARLGVALDALEETNRAYVRCCVGEDSTHLATCLTKFHLARIRGAHTNYRLMLTHFSDIDSQGHCCGVTKAANEEDTYAASRAARWALPAPLTLLIRVCMLACRVRCVGPTTGTMLQSPRRQSTCSRCWRPWNPTPSP